MLNRQQIAVEHKAGDHALLPCTWSCIRKGQKRASYGHAETVHVGPGLGLFRGLSQVAYFGWTKQPAKWAENKTKLGLN